MSLYPLRAMKYLLAAAIALLMSAAASAQSASLPEIRSLVQQSQNQKAFSRLEAYLERRPEDEEARLLKGVLLTRLGRVDEAISAFRSLAEDKPGLPEPHNNLAVLYAAQGRYDEARQSLEKAVALQPGYATARENLGDIYTRLAHLEYLRAYEVDGTNTRALSKANTMVELFEQISEGFPGSQPLTKLDPITAPAQTESKQPAPMPQPKAAPRPAPVSQAEPPPMAKPESPMTPTSEPAPTPKSQPAPIRGPVASAAEAVECFNVSGLSDEGDAAAVATWFEQRGIDAHSGVREQKQFLNFQVYTPPLESRDAAKALYKEMKAAGIQDIALIYKGTLTNGISLGIYSTESAARRRMTLVKERGFEVDFRYRNRTRQVPFVEATAPEGVVNQNAFSQAFPDFDIAPTPCR